MKLVSGNSNRPFAARVATLLEIELTKSDVKRFSDNEIFVEILENIRGQDIFVIQSTSYPANDHVMELLIMIDALKRASARRITAVIPYFGYARQDRKTGSRTPISAKLVANLIITAGADRVMTVDLHADQIQGFFDVPADNLFCSPVFALDIEKKYGSKNTAIISPDIGGVKRARLIANRLGLPIAVVDKRRDAPGKSRSMEIVGDVKGKNCVIIDDIVDSGNTLCSATETIMKAGAKSVSAYISHGVLPNDSYRKIEQSLLKELIITDSIKPTKNFTDSKKIKTLSIAHLIAEAIRRTANNQSVSSLFMS